MEKRELAVTRIIQRTISCLVVCAVILQNVFAESADGINCMDKGFLKKQFLKLVYCILI